MDVPILLGGTEPKRAEPPPAEDLTQIGVRTESSQHEELQAEPNPPGSSAEENGAAAGDPKPSSATGGNEVNFEGQVTG